MQDDQDQTMTEARVSNHTIVLTARSSGDDVFVTGDGGATLAPKSGAHNFDFELVDETSLNVRFKDRNSMLDCADNTNSCPPPSGMNSTQIVGLRRPSDTRAGFTDNNDNSQANMPVSYQLNFECDDPSKTVHSFDPIIINGGK